MITQEVLVPNATAQQIYDVLMQVGQHEKLIGDSVQIENKVGSDFSTFSGYSTGTNLELKPGNISNKRGAQATGQKTTIQLSSSGSQTPMGVLKSSSLKITYRKVLKKNLKLAGKTTTGSQ